MKYFVLTVSSVFLISSSVFSQSDTLSRFIFNPPGLHFATLKGNYEEPRIGVLKFLDAAEMKVDIGNSIDILGFDLPASGMRFTAGIDFLAYAYTTGAQGLRLQVDALEGFFGGNICFSMRDEEKTFQTRLRLLHHSSHFVDGHYDASTGSWIDGREPFPYTKDFGELVGACVFRGENSTFRPYVGVGYATLIRPPEFERFSFLGGGEVGYTVGSLAGEEINLYGTYQLTVEGTPTYRGSHQIQTGAKLGKVYGKGLALYLLYYNGVHMFGEYSDVLLNMFGIGFTVDFI